MAILFVTGIDTDIGKSYATGAITKSILNSDCETGKTVFTQKLVETGCGIEPDNGKRFSQDLLIHEKIVGRAFNTADHSLHAPYLFERPASPHLSAQLENKTIDIDKLRFSIQSLSEQCDHLIIEGAGGLYVPLNQKQTLSDLIQSLSLPVILVTSGRLGSINHTLLSLEHCANKHIPIHSVVYNTYSVKKASTDGDHISSIIEDDTRQILKKTVSEYSIKTDQDIQWYELNSDPSLYPEFCI